jgi:hypothetical protein
MSFAVSRILSVLICCQCFPYSLALATEQRSYAMAGLEGPVLHIQAFVTAMFGFRVNRYVDINLYGSAGGQSTDTPGRAGMTMRGTIYGVPLSVYPLGFREDWLRGSFFRVGPAYQKMSIEKCVNNCEKGEIQDHQQWLDSIEEDSWNARSYGFDVSVGYKLEMGNFMAEFIPATYYKSIKRNVTGPTDGNDMVELRIFTWRAGYIF